MTAHAKIGNYRYSLEPRWGFGRPVHRRLAEIIERERDTYKRHLADFAKLAPSFAAIPLDEPADPHAPFWRNPWFSGLDAVALYGFLAQTNPRLMIEVGSGNSTKFARRAIRDHGLRTRIVSIDPEPRAEIDALCDEVIRVPAEKVDPALFARLKPGDILFIDSSHRSFENSDVTTLFLEVLPELPAGVLVQVHDVYLPWDYPPQAEGLLYNEQYLLAAWLLAEGKGLQTIMPNWHVSEDRPLSEILRPIWSGLNGDVQRAGWSYWLQVKKRR